MDCSTPGFPDQHQLPELVQTHVHRVGDAIQPSHPLSSPSPPAFNLSQHEDLFQGVSSLHQVAKVLEFQFQHQSFQWIFWTDNEDYRAFLVAQILNQMAHGHVWPTDVSFLPVLSQIGLELPSPLQWVRTLMPLGPRAYQHCAPPPTPKAQCLGITLLWLFLGYGFSGRRMKGKMMKSYHQAPDKKWTKVGNGA